MSPEDIDYLTGLNHEGHFAFTLLVLPLEGAPLLPARAMEGVTTAAQMPQCRHVAFVDYEDPAEAATEAVLAADVVSVDNQMDGGPLNLKRGAGMCEVAGLLVLKHSLGELGVAAYAGVHVMASTPNFIYANQGYGSFLSDDVVKGAGPLPYENGCLTVPEGPGIGVELDEEKVGRAFLKDESHRLGLPAFKILGDSWAGCCAVSRRVGADPHAMTVSALRSRVADAGLADLTLVTATGGNHGRAVARTAALLGVRARVRVPRDVGAGRRASRWTRTA